MQNTIVAVYDRFEQANGALSALLDAGFARGSVQLNPHADRTGVARASSVSEQRGEGASLGDFFRALFGMEDRQREHGDMYAEAVRRGSSVLTVEAADERERERAVAILRSFHPADMEQRLARWRSKGWSGYDVGAPLPAQNELVEEQALLLRDDEQPYIYTRPPVDAVGRPAATTRNNDFADTMAAAADAEYRRHWRDVYGSTGGRYEDYDAAYRYGSAVGADTRFHAYRWEDAEPVLRNDWEARHPGNAWEQVREAVRFGAEKTTGQGGR